jgi:hypothetical protein
VEVMKTPESGPSRPPDKDLDTYLSEVLQNTLGGEIASTDAAAAVVLPDKEDLTIRLVSQHSLERLRDAEADKAVYDNLLWCLLGGLVGFATNIVTGSQRIDAVGYTFLAFIVLITGAVLAMRRRLVRRLTEARGRVHVGANQARKEL